MSPQIKPAKVQITKAIDGRLHVSISLGPRVSVRMPKPVPPACIATLGIHEPAPFKGESFEAYLDRLYAPIQEAR
jgi:hypothetical protein